MKSEKRGFVLFLSSGDKILNGYVNKKKRRRRKKEPSVPSQTLKIGGYEKL